MRFLQSLWAKIRESWHKPMPTIKAPATSDGSSDDIVIVRYRPQIDLAIKKILANRANFEKAVEGTFIPWWWVACVMYRENGVDMSRQLLNGQRWDRITTLVPKGLGPWGSWIDSAKFALAKYRGEGMHHWDIATAIVEWEKWNGLGYKRRGLNSPYVYSGTSRQNPGLYVADGKFDPRKMDPRPGCLAIYIGLKELGYV